MRYAELEATIYGAELSGGHEAAIRYVSNIRPEQIGNFLHDIYAKRPSPDVEITALKHSMLQREQDKTATL